MTSLLYDVQGMFISMTSSLFDLGSVLGLLQGMLISKVRVTSSYSGVFNTTGVQTFISYTHIKQNCGFSSTKFSMPSRVFSNICIVFAE